MRMSLFRINKLLYVKGIKELLYNVKITKKEAASR